MATLLFLLILTLFLAALGRDATPAAERRQLRPWTWRALAVNVTHGAGRLTELSERQRRLWDVYLDPQPWHRRSDQHDGSTGRHEHRDGDPC